MIYAECYDKRTCRFKRDEEDGRKGCSILTHGYETRPCPFRKDPVEPEKKRRKKRKDAE